MKNPEERLKEFDNYLLTRAKKNKTNFLLHSAIQIIHNSEGTTLFFDNAIAIKEKNIWYVITEHNGNHWYSVDEVIVRCYKRIDNKDAEGPLKRAK